MPVFVLCRRIIVPTALFFTARSSAFLIAAPARVPSLAGTLFNWTWELDDPRIIGIWVGDSVKTRGECPLLNDSDDPDFKKLEIVVDQIKVLNSSQKDQSGSNLIKTRLSGSVVLCAFSYEGSAASPSSIIFLNASAPISVVPIPATITESQTIPSGSQVSTTVTETSVFPVVSGAPDNKGSTPSSAAIAAIAISAIAITILALLIIFLFRRRRRQRIALADSSKTTPYSIMRSSSAPEKYNRCDRLRVNTITSQMTEQDTSSSSPTFTRELTTYGTDFSQQMERQRRIRYHDDSGWRPSPISSASESNQESILEMPPDYDAAL